MGDDIEADIQRAVLRFLRGEIDHVQIVRTRNGELVLEWERADEEEE